MSKSTLIILVGTILICLGIHAWNTKQINAVDKEIQDLRQWRLSRGR